jgi:uncharacterized protein YcsI (UPF0317 family)
LSIGLSFDLLVGFVIWCSFIFSAAIVCLSVCYRCPEVAGHCLWDCSC